MKHAKPILITAGIALGMIVIYNLMLKSVLQKIPGVGTLFT